MPDNSPTPVPRVDRRGGLWVALGLALAVLVVLGGMKLYRQRFTLTAEKLQSARDRWESAGIRSYDVEIAVSGTTSGQYHLRVRNNQIVSATLNGQPFERPEQARPWTLPELFHILEQDLINDARPGAFRASTQVEFDPVNGHIVRYRRQQLGGGTQRLDLAVKLTPAE